MRRQGRKRSRWRGPQAKPRTRAADKDAGQNAEAKAEIKELFADADEVFITPKPEKLIRQILSIASDANLLIETKKSADVGSEEVVAKAKAAAEWCKHATAYSALDGGKPWRYLLIPHDAVAVNKMLAALASTYEQRTVE